MAGVRQALPAQDEGGRGQVAPFPGSTLGLRCRGHGTGPVGPGGAPLPVHAPPTQELGLQPPPSTGTSPTSEPPSPPSPAGSSSPRPGASPDTTIRRTRWGRPRQCVGRMRCGRRPPTCGRPWWRTVTGRSWSPVPWPWDSSSSPGRLAARLPWATRVPRRARWRSSRRRNWGLRHRAHVPRAATRHGPRGRDRECSGGRRRGRSR